MTQDVLRFLFSRLDIEAILGAKGPINLTTFSELQRTSIPSDFQVRTVSLEKGDHSEVDKLVRLIIAGMDGIPYMHDIYPVLNDSVLNAVQHGNDGDPNKQIKIGYRVSKRYLDVMVEDVGGVVDPKFVSFVNEHRTGKLTKDSQVSFYDFKNVDTPPGNWGVGTNIIHMHADGVNYYLSKGGGLIIHMRKRIG